MNWHALYAALDVIRDRRHLMWKDVAAQIGIHQSTLTRLGKAQGTDATTYAKCCRWLGVSLDTFAPPGPIADEITGPELAADLHLLFARHRVPEVYWVSLANLITSLTEQAHHKRPHYPRR